MAAQLEIPAVASQTGAALPHIVVVEGEGAINNIRQRTTQGLTIRLEDENKQPLAGAAVVFTLPSTGPSGVFSNDSKTLTMTTDAQGMATAHGWKPNRVAGKMDIRVNASHQGRTARADITQFNMMVTPAGRPAGKVIAILAIVGAAAAGGVYAATMRKSGTSNAVSSATLPPIGINPGAGGVGAPQ